MKYFIIYIGIYVTNLLLLSVLSCQSEILELESSVVFGQGFFTDEVDKSYIQSLEEVVTKLGFGSINGEDLIVDYLPSIVFPQ